MPDERQLTKGIGSTDVPAQLRSMVDALVGESTRIEDGCVAVPECIGDGSLTVLTTEALAHVWSIC